MQRGDRGANTGDLPADRCDTGLVDVLSGRHLEAPYEARFVRRRGPQGARVDEPSPRDLRACRSAPRWPRRKHVEAALEFGVDVIWVGARTTVNPFSVQDIADALKGSDVTVLIKNPMNPDIELWGGADRADA